MTIKPLIAGNWKMNGLRAAVNEFETMVERFDSDLQQVVDLMICPPATLIHDFASKREKIVIGAQDCHGNEKGAHTGDLSAEILVDSGAKAIIVGHSERRADHSETNAEVRAKAEAAKRAGATAIVCVGETRQEREVGKAIDVVLSQVDGSLPDGATRDGMIVAYEPVWAIGTGLIPTVDDVKEMHAAIRDALVARFKEDGAGIRILYGGSVKPDNANDLMAVENVNGALVGGASLKSEDFLAIAEVYRAG